MSACGRGGGTDLRRYLITVDGTPYEVEVEEVGAFPRKETEREAEKPAVNLSGDPLPPTPVRKKTEQPAAQSVAPEPSSGTKIIAPMPGKIVSVKIGPGQAVKRGDVLMVLEAMKMENEIQAPVAGTITAIAVSEGANVNAGALLACIG